MPSATRPPTSYIWDHPSKPDHQDNTKEELRRKSLGNTRGPRLFDPNENGLFRDIPGRDLIYYNKTKRVNQLCLQDPITQAMKPYFGTVVIRVGGHRRSLTPRLNKEHECVAPAESWEIFVGDGSEHNASGTTDAGLLETAHGSRFLIILRALGTIERIASTNADLRSFTILSNFKEEIEILTTRIETWIQNSGHHADGKRIGDFMLANTIDCKLNEMKRRLIKVQFWHTRTCDEFRRPKNFL
ncbi:hypothetical protein F5Y09DRAFT_353085 [Xylaria sp. FL1042]|nr:hypothetical protein F5Y09DRAFT_353085 [Xylaria sp. FL1042]